MMSRSEKGLQIKKAVGEEYYNNNTTEIDGDIPTSYVKQFGEPPITFKPAGPRQYFLKGSKSALDAPKPTDVPIYHIRIRDTHTGKATIVGVRIFYVI